MIDQQDYQLLKTIGEQGSVQRAASALGVSWPSISKRLVKIESKLNVTLFERRRGRSGIAPLPVVDRVLAEYESFSKTLSQAIEDNSSANGHKQQANIRVGVGSTIGTGDIDRAMEIAGRLGDLAITDLSTNTALKALEDGHVDLALLAEPSYPDHFKSYLVSIDPFQVAFPTGHRFENQSSIQLSDLDQEYYINRSLCEFPRYFAEQTGGEVIKPEGVRDGPHRITNEVVAQIMIRRGHGVAVIPESLVVLQGLKTRALVRPSINRRIALVALADSPLNQRLQSNDIPAVSRGKD